MKTVVYLIVFFFSFTHVVLGQVTETVSAPWSTSKSIETIHERLEQGEEVSLASFLSYEVYMEGHMVTKIAYIKDMKCAIMFDVDGRTEGTELSLPIKVERPFDDTLRLFGDDNFEVLIGDPKDLDILQRIFGRWGLRI